MATEMGQQMITPSVPSFLTEVCYDGGVAFIEGRRDKCGRLITGEASKIYTVNAAGQWVEIASPDITLLEAGRCAKVASVITGCIDDPDNPGTSVPAYWNVYDDGTTSEAIQASNLPGFVVGCCE